MTNITETLILNFQNFGPYLHHLKNVKHKDDLKEFIEHLDNLINTHKERKFASSTFT